MSPTSHQEEPKGHPISSSPTPDPARQSLLTRPPTVLLLLALLAAAIYSNTFSASFHFDDQLNIIENPWIKQLFYLRDLSGSRYVGFLTFALNYHFGGLSVFGYHLVNLLIHITNGFLVYVLVRLLFRASDTSGAARTTTASWIALAAALLFVVHPIQTQAVTYIVQRFTSLAAMFYLLTVVCYLYWRLSPPDRKSRNLWYAGALIATILAMKTKENTFTLPFMLLLIEAVFFAPLIRRSWIRLTPFLLMLPIIPLSRHGALGEGEAGFASDITDISRWDYLLTQFRVITTYLRLLIFPVNQNLDYDYPVSHSLFDPPVFFSFLFLSALFVLALYLLFSSRLVPNFNGAPPSRPGSNPPAQWRLPYAASRLVGFGILWFFLTLSIESSLIPIRDVIYEHRLYLPSIGFWLAAGTVLIGVFQRRPIVGIMAVGALVTIFSVATYQRNKVWQDELTLWSDVVRKSPEKARPHYTLGMAYAKQKEWDEAINQYRIAIKITPNDPKAHYNLGNTEKALGRFDEAVQEYLSALRFDPDYAEAHNNLGLVYETLGRRDEAIREYQAALASKPSLAETHNNLGVVYKDQGRLKEALHEYQVALMLDPDFAEAHNNLGVILKLAGREEMAIKEYRAAIALRPDYPEAHNNLGNVYQALDRQDEALREYRLALSLDQTDAQTYINLAKVYSAKGQLSEAATLLKQATRLKPDNLQAHNNLGNVYKNLGRLDDAIREYQTALTINPDYTFARNNLGMVYYTQGRLSEALRAFQRSIQVNPDDAQVHYITGLIYKKTGRMKEAVREYKNVVKLKPDSPEAYFNLGQTYQRMGQTQNAARAFERALQIKPDYAKARQALKSLPR
jgi:protein O-mannosyl-transferase